MNSSRQLSNFGITRDNESSFSAHKCESILESGYSTDPETFKTSLNVC